MIRVGKRDQQKKSFYQTLGLRNREKISSWAAGDRPAESRAGRYKWLPFPPGVPCWLWFFFALCRWRGSKDLGKEPFVGSGLVLGVCQSSSFPPSWPCCLPGPQLLLCGTLSKCPGAVRASSIPIRCKEAFSPFDTLKIEVSLSLCLGDFCS